MTTREPDAGYMRELTQRRSKPERQIPFVRGRHQTPAQHLGSVIQRPPASSARHRTTR
jgi:hypothetical protein